MKNTNQKKQLWILIIIVFLGFLGISMPYLIFPSLFLQVENSVLTSEWSSSSRSLLLGLTLAAYPLGQFIGSPILGSLSDEFGRKRLLCVSLLFTALANLFTGLAVDLQNISLLISSRFFGGIMEGNIAIARALATDLTSLSKHKTFGKINAAASIAFLLGPFLGGLMSDKSIFESFSASTPFYFVCFLFVILSLISALFLKGREFVSFLEKRSFGMRINIFRRIVALFANKRLKILLILSTCFTLAVDIFYEFGPVYLTLKWESSPSDLVLYNGVLCLALAIGNGFLSGFVSSRFSTRWVTILAMGVYSFLLIGIVLADSCISMAVLFAASGLAIGLAVTLITVEISDSVSDSIQGEVMGVQVSLRVLGDALICLFGGFLLLLSSKLILLFAALVCFSTMGYYAAFSRNRSITLY